MNFYVCMYVCVCVWYTQRILLTFFCDPCSKVHPSVAVHSSQACRETPGKWRDCERTTPSSRKSSRIIRWPWSSRTRSVHTAPYIHTCTVLDRLVIFSCTYLNWFILLHMYFVYLYSDIRTVSRYVCRHVLLNCCVYTITYHTS